MHELSSLPRWTVLPALAATVLLACAVGAGAQAGTEPVVDRLPDLQQEPPTRIIALATGPRTHRRYVIVFGSTTDNDGEGPLIVVGRRRTRAVNRMTAEQEIRRSDGSTRTVPAVGRLQFVVNSDHRHWHFLGYDRYELRTEPGFARVVRDRKTGFCIGDRGRAGFVAPSAPPAPVYTDFCGRNKPGLLTLREGMSPGYFDYYGPVIEGQFLDVTRLHAGRYYLVHRVNATRSFVESDYSNNASLVLLSLAWPGGHSQRPRVRVLRRCPAQNPC